MKTKSPYHTLRKYTLLVLICFVWSLANTTAYSMPFAEETETELVAEKSDSGNGEEFSAENYFDEYFHEVVLSFFTETRETLNNYGEPHVRYEYRQSIPTPPPTF